MSDGHGSAVELLRSLGMSTWSRHPGASEAEVARVERRFGVHLPADYRELLLYSNGGGLVPNGTAINFAPVEGLERHNTDERFRERIPGMFVIGDDGEGGVYYFDPPGRLRHGPYALFLVPLGDLGFRGSRFAASTVTELLKEVLSGADLYQRPVLGDAGRA